MIYERLNNVSLIPTLAVKSGTSCPSLTWIYMVSDQPGYKAGQGLIP